MTREGYDRFSIMDRNPFNCQQRDRLFIVETNPQTPSFWMECTEGNRKVTQHLGLEDPDINSQTILKLTLNRHIQRAAR